jgi:phytoene synthase
MCALYAFARHTDDLGDSDLSPSTRMQSLIDWRYHLTRALAGDFLGQTWPALADTVQRFAIPPQYLFDIIDGVQSDVERVEFESFDELRHYCYRVASSVGLACLHIWGFSDPRAIELAIDRGIAFQLTNILRDIREDAQRDRIYVPREDLQHFSCQADDLRQAAPADRVRNLLQFEIERAESFYRRSRGLVHLVEPDGRRMLRLMTATYWHLLQSVRRQQEKLPNRPIRLGLLAKLRIINSAFLPWGTVRRERFGAAVRG